MTIINGKLAITVSGYSQKIFHPKLGWLRAVSNGKALIRIDWNQYGWKELNNPDDVSRETIRQLESYIAGKRTKFDLPVQPEGTTDTAQAWLNIIKLIPYGSTITYKELAVAAGKPPAARNEPP